MGDANPKREHAIQPELHCAITHQPTIFFVCTPDLLDMSRMVLRTKGPQRLPRGYEIVLYIPVSDADKVGVFYMQSKSFLASCSASFLLICGALISLQALFFPSLTLSSPCSSIALLKQVTPSASLLQIFPMLSILSSQLIGKLCGLTSKGTVP